MAADIVIATINARYAHASFGLRYLLANMGGLADRTRMLEFDLRQDPATIAAAILAERPAIIGLGVYIWNVAPTLNVIQRLREGAPDVVIVLGGPEVSYEVDVQPICRAADVICTGEADLTFPELCRRILQGDRPVEHVIPGPPVDVRRLQLPYEFYTDIDIAQRVIYVEASRGCPFTCEFCLSSLDSPVRRFPLDLLLPAFDRLLERGVRHFKFVDRTFNLSVAYSVQLMEYFLRNYRPGLFLHFEMIPDRLPEELRQLIRAFPARALQFEVGIQTFNEAVAARIRRRQDYAKTVENLRFLRQETDCHIHADLIFGLPGESLESFGAGFDRLVALGPQEIQVNRLKRLRGTPIVRHDAAFAVQWRSDPPYDILSNNLIDAPRMERLQRFSRFWDRIANSGDFLEITALLSRATSPFQHFMELSDGLFARFRQTHGIALESLAEALFDYLVARGHPVDDIAATLARDYQRPARRDLPLFLRPHLPDHPRWAGPPVAAAPGLGRQYSHSAES